MCVRAHQTGLCTYALKAPSLSLQFVSGGAHVHESERRKKERDKRGSLAFSLPLWVCCCIGQCNSSKGFLGALCPSALFFWPLCCVSGKIHSPLLLPNGIVSEEKGYPFVQYERAITFSLCVLGGSQEKCSSGPNRSYPKVHCVCVAGVCYGYVFVQMGDTYTA